MTCFRECMGDDLRTIKIECDGYFSRGRHGGSIVEENPGKAVPKNCQPLLNKNDDCIDKCNA
ncbi:hypothetical protein Ciccas_008234 [Cichlidogyrus casuarinus]|uniref:Uncharacterized protein n=1 Tax=Cichlidogyrus casuarinus TaxID=1844966 RepID=A0ABD2Q354_9PLAT